MPRHWPYEETEIHPIDGVPGGYRIATPWLESRIEVEPKSQADHALGFLAQHGPEPMADPANAKAAAWMSETFEALLSLPIAYQLPRREETFGVDAPASAAAMDLTSPRTLARRFGVNFAEGGGDEWSWDLEGALAVSSYDEAGRTIDPITLLTIARRFHYLDCLAAPMDDVYALVAEIQDPATREAALARIVRQNHYVTAECEAAVSPARAIAGSAATLVDEFVRAERGHDRLLERSLTALGVSSGSLEPLVSTANLMTFLRGAGETNFLAFCIALDFFEKPQFRDDDALGAALIAGGRPEAAQALETHKKINDQGEHDQVAREFLSLMRPVSAEYAAQAFRLAELVSACIAAVPAELASELDR